MPATWELGPLRRRRDHIDDHIGARINDANRFVLQHDVAITPVNRRETNDRRGQRMQPYRARHGGANIDGDVEPGAVDLAITQNMLSNFRVLLFARLYPICRLRLAGLVGGPALGGLALLAFTIRTLSLLLIAFAGRPCGLFLVVVLTLASGSILTPALLRALHLVLVALAARLRRLVLLPASIRALSLAGCALTSAGGSLATLRALGPIGTRLGAPALAGLAHAAGGMIGGGLGPGGGTVLATRGGSAAWASFHLFGGCLGASTTTLVRCLSQCQRGGAKKRGK